jgi:hypothetical protein
MLKTWIADIELNYDSSRVEEFDVEAITDINAYRKLKEKVRKKYPNIGTRFRITNLREY